MKMIKVKICGIMDIGAALTAVDHGADALGFVFAHSKRRITPDAAKNIIEQLPPGIEKVGVFVNEAPEMMEEIAAYCGLTMIQLHGEESHDICKQLRYHAIKAVGIASEEDVQQAMLYPCSYILVDSPKGHLYQGGNGQTFDWHLVEKLHDSNKNIILAGGLNHENVSEAIRVVRPFMVDVSSGVESNDVKDHRKIQLFLQAAKGEDVQ